MCLDTVCHYSAYHRKLGHSLAVTIQRTTEDTKSSRVENYSAYPRSNLIIIIIDNFCIALFSGVHRLTVLHNLFNINFLSEKKREENLHNYAHRYRPHHRSLGRHGPLFSLLWLRGN